MNLTTDLTTSEAPIAILKGEIESKDDLIFMGDGWIGKIESEKLEFRKGNEKLVMERLFRNSPTINARHLQMPSSYLMEQIWMPGPKSLKRTG